MSGYFDKKYADYWKERVGTAADGTKVPGEDVERFFIQKANIAPSDRVLDLGCGHGRLYPLLRKFTEHVYGTDINEAALKEAKQYPYKKLGVGSAEKTGLDSDYFDKIVAWGVYDGVEQEKALREQNRILKNGGALLITGKNKDYEADDEKAFTAETNAASKGFPNHFTDVYGLMRDIGALGYEVLEGYGFARRGDFGEMKFFALSAAQPRRFYEFLLILRKTGAPAAQHLEICYEHSNRYKESNG